VSSIVGPEPPGTFKARNKGVRTEIHVTNHDLTQADIRRAFEVQGDGPWTTVYDEIQTDGVSGGSYCALADPSQRDRALTMDGWLAHKRDGGPGFMQSYEDGKEVTTYLPTGDSDDSVELLVLVREFHGAAEPVIELDQQFRLFHNLRYVSSSNTYVKMNHDGTQTPAVRFAGNRVEIRTALLKQYIAARQMDLLLFTDINVHSAEKPASSVTERFATATYSGRLDYYESRYSSSGRYASRYCATKLVPPGPMETCGIWPFEEGNDEYPEFIIGEDPHGKPIKYSCNPDMLANYFGANPEAPHYLTPVHFRRDVLAKYYDNPHLYTVEDGYLRCASLWGVEIDNDHDDRVVVFLGDLGRKLPASERDHWRAYMIPPDAPISDTNLRRSFYAMPTDPTAADLVFRRAYRDASVAWLARYGWPLFREPKESDVYLLQQLRVPLNDTDNEFEEAVKLLGKLMSDALNESAIGQHLPERIEGEKGISKFERFLQLEGYPNVEVNIKYLRRVQELRSKVSAHLKGRAYEKVLTKNLGEARGAQAIQDLLEEGVTFLHDLISWLGPTEDDGAAPDQIAQDDQTEPAQAHKHLIEDLGYAPTGDHVDEATDEAPPD